MGLSNTNMTGLHMPEWEILTAAGAIGIAGTNIVDDNKRYIYVYFQTSATAAQFHRFDTWRKTWQILAVPATQTGTVANMVYAEGIGGQWSGKTYGAIYLFVGNGTACYLYKYDIATMSWGSNLGTTNVPAAFATDCYLMHPGPSRNNWEGGYHSGVLRTITLGAGIAVGATSATVAALPEALPVGTRLRFGTFNVTLTAGALKGATSLTVTALAQGMAAGTILTIPTLGIDIALSSAVAAGATTVPVFPVGKDIPNSTSIVVEQFIVLTAAAAAAATSITIASALYTVTNGSTALYYGNVYLVGNNATQMYRYNKGANAWATTSANSGNPALAALPGSAGAGCALKWLPAYAPDKLWCLRGGATATTYIYDLVANTWSTETYYPVAETFTTGSSVASRSINGKQSSLLIQKDNTNRIFEGIPFRNTLETAITQDKIAHGTAVVGDKSCCLTTPDGIEFYYMVLHSSTGFVRTALLDS